MVENIFVKQINSELFNRTIRLSIILNESCIHLQIRLSNNWYQRAYNKVKNSDGVRNLLEDMIETSLPKQLCIRDNLLAVKNHRGKYQKVDPSASMGNQSKFSSQKIT